MARQPQYTAKSVLVRETAGQMRQGVEYGKRDAPGVPVKTILTNVRLHRLDHHFVISLNGSA